jgi:hypothetical protein
MKQSRPAQQVSNAKPSIPELPTLPAVMTVSRMMQALDGAQQQHCLWQCNQVPMCASEGTISSVAVAVRVRQPHGVATQQQNMVE